MKEVDDWIWNIWRWGKKSKWNMFIVVVMVILLVVITAGFIIIAIVLILMVGYYGGRNAANRKNIKNTEELGNIRKELSDKEAKYKEERKKLEEKNKIETDILKKEKKELEEKNIKTIEDKNKIDKLNKDINQKNDALRSQIIILKEQKDKSPIIEFQQINKTSGEFMEKIENIDKYLEEKDKEYDSLKREGKPVDKQYNIVYTYDLNKYNTDNINKIIAHAYKYSIFHFIIKISNNSAVLQFDYIPLSSKTPGAFWFWGDKYIMKPNIDGINLNP